MIHSLAGGEMGELTYKDYAKVEIEGQGVYWYVTTIHDLKEGDLVLVPFGRLNTLTQAKVLRIDKNVSSQFSPIPSKHAKEIFSKI